MNSQDFWVPSLHPRGLDASKLWRLRLICRGSLVDVNTRPRQLGQQPLLMAPLLGGVHPGAFRQDLTTQDGD